jgi:hypothetical protein
VVRERVTEILPTHQPIFAVLYRPPPDGQADHGWAQKERLLQFTTELPALTLAWRVPPPGLQLQHLLKLLKLLRAEVKQQQEDEEAELRPAWKVEQQELKLKREEEERVRAQKKAAEEAEVRRVESERLQEEWRLMILNDPAPPDPPPATEPPSTVPRPESSPSPLAAPTVAEGMSAKGAIKGAMFASIRKDAPPLSAAPDAPPLSAASDAPPLSAAPDANCDKFAVYHKMKKMGLPDGPIRQKMLANGEGAADVAAFFGEPVPVETEEEKERIRLTKIRKMRQDVKVEAEAMTVPDSMTVPVLVPADLSDAKFAPYHKMKKMGLPDGPIRQKMLANGEGAANVAAFFGEPVPVASATKTEGGAKRAGNNQKVESSGASSGNPKSELFASIRAAKKKKAGSNMSKQPALTAGPALTSQQMLMASIHSRKTGGGGGQGNGGKSRGGVFDEATFREYASKHFRPTRLLQVLKECETHADEMLGDLYLQQSQLHDACITLIEYFGEEPPAPAPAPAPDPSADPPSTLSKASDDRSFLRSSEMLKLMHESVGMFTMAMKKYDFKLRKQQRELRQSLPAAVADPGDDVVTVVGAGQMVVQRLDNVHVVQYAWGVGYMQGSCLRLQVDEPEEERQDEGGKREGVHKRNLSVEELCANIEAGISPRSAIEARKIRGADEEEVKEEKGGEDGEVTHSRWGAAPMPPAPLSAPLVQQWSWSSSRSLEEERRQRLAQQQEATLCAIDDLEKRMAKLMKPDAPPRPNKPSHKRAVSSTTAMSEVLGVDTRTRAMSHASHVNHSPRSPISIETRARAMSREGDTKDQFDFWKRHSQASKTARRDRSTSVSSRQGRSTSTISVQENIQEPFTFVVTEALVDQPESGSGSLAASAAPAAAAPPAPPAPPPAAAALAAAADSNSGNLPNLSALNLLRHQRAEAAKAAAGERSAAGQASYQVPGGLGEDELPAGGGELPAGEDELPAGRGRSSSRAEELKALPTSLGDIFTRGRSNTATSLMAADWQHVEEFSGSGSDSGSDGDYDGPDAPKWDEIGAIAQQMARQDEPADDVEFQPLGGGMSRSGSFMQRNSRAPSIASSIASPADEASRVSSFAGLIRPAEKPAGTKAPSNYAQALVGKGCKGGKGKGGKGGKGGNGKGRGGGKEEGGERTRR